jgi:alpha-galactosidase
VLKTFSTILVLLVAPAVGYAQPMVNHFDAAAKVFRLDGGGVSYLFGVNARGELEQLYWGGRLGATDKFPQAVPMREWASFDSS